MDSLLRHREESMTQDNELIMMGFLPYVPYSCLTRSEEIIKDRLMDSGWSEKEAEEAAKKCGDSIGPINKDENWLPQT